MHTLGLVFCLRYFDDFISNRDFTVETDHKALLTILDHSTRVVANWLSIICEYSFDILYMFLVLLTSVQIPLADSIQTLSGAVATASNPLRREPRRNNSSHCPRHQSPTSSANSSWPCTSRDISGCWLPWKPCASVATHGQARYITCEYVSPTAQHAEPGQRTSRDLVH